MHLKNDRPFVFRSRNFTHRVDIAVFKHKKGCVRSERSIGHRWKKMSCLDGLEDEVLGPYEVRPGWEIDAFSCLHAAYISLRKNN